ncbi:small GTP-binding protein, putative [Trichomonas vaginalis G3]|uniref:Ras-related protein Rab-7b n=2 Tax=Trichomonas vaginalis TaxID=5722 RepID=A0A8U0WPM1_TRIV3|nr:small Rab GTPase Rab7a [Trichomonas vaginalis G3]AAX97453.1 small Rab GTPase Rab7a [Trichomonas vaginalis]EAY15800.1 small GTP-binding protein, putative [Trichomonas vaginalis G3]KAI5525029.1 small Rab GTPase Rab7a [Trichomonas vaginalis G3]|eukprot:XP_001328023.1 small GTP-binding protein [Trichomonas vaginalis G3]
MASRGRQMLKLLLLGDASVGKTSLLNQFVNREFTSSYKATIGSDFSSKQLDVDGHYVTLQIWDTAGQERFQSLGPTFYRGTDCCILVYDVTKPASFENIKKWRNEFSLQLGLSNASDFPFLLLGNKSDLPDKAVQPSAAREFAQMNGDMIFEEVSAKTAEGVQTAFEAIVRKALEKAPAQDFVLPQSVVNIENKPAEKQGGCC